MITQIELKKNMWLNYKVLFQYLDALAMSR